MLKIITYIVFIALFSINLNAQTSVDDYQEARANFCADRIGSEDVRMMTFDINNRLSFDNDGGLFNGGVCWWHSRFNRNASYLALFRADLPRPKTQKEIENIIRDIRIGKNIVIVPGYENLREFSIEHEDLIQKRLDLWQIGDGFVRQQWIRGLYGKTSTTAAKLKRRMNELYKQVVLEDKIVFQHLQLAGIMAHAWLVVDVEKMNDGYRLKYIDSNFNKTKTYDYKFGETSLSLGWYGEFIAYTGKDKEVERLKKTLKAYCN